MKTVIKLYPLLSKLILAALTIIFVFVPLISESGFNANTLTLLIGKKVGDITLFEGTFWALFPLVIIPFLLIYNVVSLDPRKIVTAICSLVALVSSFMLRGHISDITYGYANGGGALTFAIFLLFVLLALAFLAVLYQKGKLPTQKIDTALQKGASELAGKTAAISKNIIAGVSNPEVHRAARVAEQIKIYKDLLDSGSITQEEYDAKKAEIMKEA